MIVPCECSAKLKIDDAKVADRDVRVRCPRCGNILTVQRRTPEPAASRAPQAEPAGSAGRGAPLVLVAHDSDVVREMVGGVLLDAGFHVEHAADGVEAMAKATAKRPDIMIIDVGIPGIYGFELCERLKGDAGTQGIKIILLASVYGITRYKRNPTSLYGADDFIEKHHIADDLIGKVNRLLDANAQPAAAPPPASLPERTEERKPPKADAEMEPSFFRPESMMGDDGDERAAAGPGVQSHVATNPVPPDAQEIAPESFSLESSIFEKEECDIPLVEEKDPEAVEKARRFARIIVSDIALYNQDAVREGVRKGTFYDLLRDDIEEGRRLYEARVPAAVRSRTDYYTETIENFIASQKKIAH